MSKKRKLKLTLYLEKGIDPEDVVLYLNCESLCALEEDEKMITGWKWGYPNEDM